MTANALPRLSAASLEDLDRCKRRFALRYRANRYWPGPQPGDDDPAGTESARTGTLFHRLVQQSALGIDVQGTLDAEGPGLPRLLELWRKFEASPHSRLKQDGWSEAPLHFSYAGVHFVARFDRLSRHPEGWEILDWKTGGITPLKLKTSWQTRLYRFSLAIAGHVYNEGQPIAPEAIKITYWDVNRSRPEPFGYDEATFQEDLRLFSEKALEAALPFDETLSEDPCFPRTKNRATCARCSFDSYCNPVVIEIKPVQLSLPLPTFKLQEFEA